MHPQEQADRLASREALTILRGFFFGPLRGVMAGKPVAIIMGSQSDWATMKHTADTLDALGIGYEAKVISAHRTPERHHAFATGRRHRASRSSSPAPAAPRTSPA